MAKTVFDERQLYETKWFDYRPLAPDTATLVFIRDWALAMNRGLERRDGKDGKFTNILRPFKEFREEDICDLTPYKSLRFLRRWADEHFMRYGDFWQWGIKAHLDLGFKQLNPNVFSNKTILKKVLEAQVEQDGRTVPLANTDLFLGRNYRGLEIQKGYHRYVIDRVKKLYPEAYSARLVEMVRTGVLSAEFFGIEPSVRA